MKKTTVKIGSKKNYNEKIDIYAIAEKEFDEIILQYEAAFNNMYEEEVGKLSREDFIIQLQVVNTDWTRILTEIFVRICIENETNIKFITWIKAKYQYCYSYMFYYFLKKIKIENKLGIEYPANMTDSDKQIIDILIEESLIFNTLSNNKYSMRHKTFTKEIFRKIYESFPDIKKYKIANFVNLYIKTDLPFSTLQTYARDLKRDIKK